MAGTVYLRTNRFEVKLEGITFKAKDFDSLCKRDFLFPKGKVWVQPPIVGVDVMRHPRDPSILLLLLCFGVGVVILKFHSGEALSDPIKRFLRDERIQFVGFGIPEKKDLFPFEKLGLTTGKVDIGYLAAQILDDQKYTRCELADLARKVIGIKRMVGLTEASSFERHEQIKCAICQLFVTSVIAMGLLKASSKKKVTDSPKKTSFLKNFNSLPMLAEGWFKSPKGKKNNQKSDIWEKGDPFDIEAWKVEDAFDDSVYAYDDYAYANPKCGGSAYDDGSFYANPKCGGSPYDDGSFHPKFEDDARRDDSTHAWVRALFSGEAEPLEDGDLGDYSTHSKDKEGISLTDSPSETAASTNKKPLKGILKSPSSRLERSTSFGQPGSSPSSNGQMTPNAHLRRANSKGYNVTFKCE